MFWVYLILLPEAALQTVINFALMGMELTKNALRNPQLSLIETIYSGNEFKQVSFC
jgi:hypothetical protein